MKLTHVSMLALLCAATGLAQKTAPSAAAPTPAAAKLEDILKAAGPVPPEGAEKIKEFKKFAADPDQRVRADQQERLSLVDHPEAALLLINSGLRDDTYRVQERAIWALSRHKNVGTIALVRLMLKTGSEEVKAGSALALSKMDPKPEGAAADVAALLASGAKESLKIQLCQALGFFADKVATPALIPLLHGTESVVLAAADAIGLIKDPTATPELIKLLKGGTWRTQVAAIDALELLRVKEAIGPLIDYLANAEGKPREDAKLALQKISGREFGMKADDWQSWWKDNEATFKVPPVQDKATVEAKETKDSYGRKAVEYHRIKTYSRRILFVVDVSASMNEIIKVKRGYDPANKKFQASPKIDLARHELKAVLKTLDKDTWFNVVCFETDVRSWKKEPVQATDAGVSEAVQWVEKQRPPDGMTARASLARDENGWIMGRTNSYGVLKHIYGRPTKVGRGVTGNPKPVGNVDTVFLLTDGEPTEGETTNIDEILKDVETWNKTGKLTIHTIGMSESSGLRTLLDGIARSTGGKCVFVGE